MLWVLRTAWIRGGREFWHAFENRAESNLVEANWNKKHWFGLPTERGNAKPLRLRTLSTGNRGPLNGVVIRDIGGRTILYFKTNRI